MNMTDSVATDECEVAAFDRAYESAELAVYEKLRDLFGVHGENLVVYLDCGVAPNAQESQDMLRDLRAAYRERVAFDANRMMGG